MPQLLEGMLIVLMAFCGCIVLPLLLFRLLGGLLGAW